MEGKVKLNRQVTWNFTPCEVSVNGVAVSMSELVKDWVGKIGPFSRDVYKCYVWDKYGLMVAGSIDEKDTLTQMHIVFNYSTFHHRTGRALQFASDSIYLSTESKDDRMLIIEELASRPNPRFNGGVLMDSIVLGRGMRIEEFNQLSEKYHRHIQFHQDRHFHHIWEYNSPCQPWSYFVEVSEDYSDIEQVWVEYDANNYAYQQTQEEQQRTRTLDSMKKPAQAAPSPVQRAKQKLRQMIK